MYVFYFCSKKIAYKRDKRVFINDVVAAFVLIGNIWVGSESGVLVIFKASCLLFIWVLVVISVGGFLPTFY